MIREMCIVVGNKSFDTELYEMKSYSLPPSVSNPTNGLWCVDHERLGTTRTDSRVLVVSIPGTKLRPVRLIRLVIFQTY